MLITGAGRGIGAATARLFAENGAIVWVTDVDADIAQSTAEQIPHARHHPLDVTDHEQWAALLARVLQKDGRLDILVNNAGVMPLGGLTETPAHIIDLILDVNVRGVLYGMQAVVPAMLERDRGHIINIASMAGKIPFPGMVAYNASKFAVCGASLAMREELRTSGVTVTSILPAVVDTELTAGASFRGMPSVGPEDVARAIVQSVHRPSAEISVPRWANAGWKAANSVVPEPFLRAVRTVLNDRQTNDTLDLNARKAYDDRVHRQAQHHVKE